MYISGYYTSYDKEKRGDLTIHQTRFLLATTALILAAGLILLPASVLAIERPLEYNKSVTSDIHGTFLPARPHEIIVRFNTTVGTNDSVLLKNRERMLETLSAVKTGKRAEVIGDMGKFGMTGLNLIRLPEEVSIDDAVAIARADPSVRYATPNYRKIPEKSPNDPAFMYQWGLFNTGQDVYGLSGTYRADIHAPEAWDTTTGSGKVVIAVLDPSGVEYSIPDLVPNTWHNPGEVPGNGKDDDKNGYVDDIVGWDFYDTNDDGAITTGEGDNDPSPDFLYDDHGTNCAGILAAAGNNGMDAAGVMWSAALMPLKFDGYTWSEVQGILYAKMMGVKVICCSFGNEVYGESSYDPPEADAMADSPGILFICSAGNNGVDTDFEEHYPSGYGYSNIISVTATDQDDRLPYYSNYGAKSVHLAAPGDNILCLDPDGTTSLGDGSSLAVPYVAGVAGLILSLKPSASVSETKNAILSGVDKVPELQGRTVTGGRLNAANSVRQFKPSVTPTRTPAVSKTPTRTPVKTKTPTPQKTVTPTKTKTPVTTPTPVKTITPQKTPVPTPVRTTPPVTPVKVLPPVTTTISGPVTGSDGWESYGSRYFRVSYPENAEFNPDPTTRDDKVMISDPDMEYSMIIEVSGDATYREISRNDLRSIDIQSIQENGGAFVGSTTGTMGGEPAVVDEYVMTFSGVRFKGTDYVTTHNGRLVMVMVFASERKYDSSGKVIDRILGSVTFT